MHKLFMRDFDAAIVHHDRVCEITLFFYTSFHLKRSALAMQEKFPALLHLELGYGVTNLRPAPALPDGFLGGSAPLLQSLILDHIPFPALTEFLLTAIDLVHLTLVRIPPTWFISPDAIMTCLAVLVNLKSLRIEFITPTDWESQGPSLPTHTTLPALTHFGFAESSKYLEDLVAHIDAPLLISIYITFFEQLIVDTVQLAQFMRRMTRFQALNEIYVDFDHDGVQVGHFPRTFDKANRLRISCGRLDVQLSSMAQVLTSFFPSIYMVEHLYIYENPRSPPYLRHGIKNVRWLGIFHPFTSMRNLYVSKEFAPHIALALKELVGWAEVFPTLQNISLESL
jgi:hypothetical protein